MSTRSFRRRLDRLERAITETKEQSKDRLAKFTVDPALVNALRDDHQRLSELNHREFLALNDKESEGLTVAEMEEKAILDKRIADSVKLLRLPSGYGAKEAELDRRRLRVFEQERNRMEPRARSSYVEDAEEEQLRARFSAFEVTPEGRGRKQMRELQLPVFIQQYDGKSNTFDQYELARLEKLYPPLELPPDPESEDVKRLVRMMDERG
jgi:hypothetical protein